MLQMEYEELGAVRNLRATKNNGRLWHLRRLIVTIINERSKTEKKYNLNNYEKALIEINEKLADLDDGFKDWLKTQPKNVDIDILASIYDAFDKEDK